MNDAKWAEMQRRFQAPVEKAARSLFSTPSGKMVLDALDEVFCSTPVERVPTTGAVDVNATLIRLGSAQVVGYLRDLAKEEGGQG